jgi:hypothetical protein
MSSTHVAPTPSASAAIRETAPAAKPVIVPGEPLGSPVSNEPTTSSGHHGDVARPILAVRPKLRACYASVRGDGPDIAGMVSCGVRITKEGKVAAISVTRRDRLPNPLVECIVRELKTMVFEPRSDEDVIQGPVRFAVPDEEG